MKRFWHIVLYLSLRWMVALCPIFEVSAASYPYTQGQRLVGRVETIRLDEANLKLNVIARSYDIGFDALLSANPSLKHPHELPYGSVLILPTLMIVPNVEPNQVVVNIAEKRMYFFHAPTNRLYVWPVGIGRLDHPTPIGDFHITHKRYKPVWHVPKSILAEAKEKGIVNHPTRLDHNPLNPLGEYAMHLSAPSYLIHGTHNASYIGTRNTNGCVNLYPEDAAEAFNLIPTGARVTIINQPVKTAHIGRFLYIESHQPVSEFSVDMQDKTLSDHFLKTLSPSLRKQFSQTSTLDNLADDLHNAEGLPFVFKVND